jgi:tetratricopeptide (TPR) repeat protein
LPAVVTVLALGTIAWLTRRRSPSLAAAVIVYFAALLPNSGLLPTDIQRVSTVADRYAYIAMLGPAMLVAWGLSRAQSRHRSLVLAASLTIAVLVALLVRTIDVTAIWRDDRTLFAHGVEENPGSWLAHTNYAFGLVGTDPAAAIEQAKIALRLKPGIAIAHQTIGGAYAALGDRASAVPELREAIRLAGPEDDLRSRRTLAKLLSDSGDRAGAIAQYRASLRLQPNDAATETNLAAELADSGQLDEAVELYRLALQQDPGLDAARLGRAQAEAALARRHGPPSGATSMPAQP